MLRGLLTVNGSGCGCSRGKIYGSGAAQTATGRWDAAGEVARVAYETQADDSMGKAFWMAYQIADSIRYYLQASQIGPPLLGISANNVPEVNPKWVNAVVDANTALRIVSENLQRAARLGWTTPAGTRAATWTRELLETAGHAATMAQVIYDGVKAAHAAALQEARRIASAMGANLEGPQLWIHRLSQAVATTGEAGKELAKEVGETVGGAVGETIKQAAEKSFPWGPLLAAGALVLGLAWLTR